MNKSAFSTLFFSWAFLCMCTFWVRFTDLGSKFFTMSPLWTILLVLGGLSLLVYIIFFRREKEITVSSRPLLFWCLFLGLVPVLFFLEYSHVLGYFSSIFTALGVGNTDVSGQLARYFSITDASLFDASSVMVKFMEKYIISVFSLIVLLFSALGTGVVWRKFLENFSLEQRIFLQTLGGLALLCIVLLFIGWAGVFTKEILWILTLCTATLGVIFESKSVGTILMKKTEHTYSLPGAVTYWVCGVLIAFVTALSFLHVLRPMPIGWDDITLYMNLPNLTSQYHHLVSGFGTYSWGLIMAMGEVLFSNPMFGMLYSFAGGMLAIWGIYTLLTYVQGEETKMPLALLLTTVLISAPFFQFQFSEDMKVDLALTAFGAGALILMIEYLRTAVSNYERKLLLLIGVILGCMLGIKFTALIFFFFASLLVGWKYGKWLITLAISLFFAAFVFAANIISLGGIEYPKTMIMPTIAVLCVLGIVALIYTILRSKDGKKGIFALLMMGLVSFMMFAPWMTYNAFSYCTPKETCSFQGLNSMLYGKLMAPTLVAKEATSSGTVIESDAVELKKILTNEGGGQVEELQRYRGFDKGLFSYATLPVDVTMGTNERGDYITIGWVLLALLPLVFMSGFLKSDTKRKNGALFLYFAVMLGVLLFIVSIAEIKVELPEQFSGIMVLLCTVLVFTGMFVLWKKSNTVEKDLPWMGIFVAATVLYWFTWTYLANGVIWYGILGFLPLLVLAKQGLEELYREDKEWLSPIVILILLCWIVPMYGYKITVNDVQVPQLGNSWKKIVEMCELTKTDTASAQVLASAIQTLVKNEQDQTAIAKACSLYRSQSITKSDFENAARAAVAETIGLQYGMPDSLTFVLYKAGILKGEEDTMAQMNPPYAKAITEIRKVDPAVKIYRVGTFMPYYTPGNDRRMLTDNQLDVFMNYYLPEKSKEAFIKTLKDSGIGYIVYDNKTQTIDKTPEQTLTKKVLLFIDFLTDNPSLEKIVGSGEPSTAAASPDSIFVYKIL